MTETTETTNSTETTNITATRETTEKKHRSVGPPILARMHTVPLLVDLDTSLSFPYQVT